MIQEIIDNFNKFMVMYNLTQQECAEEIGCCREHLSRVLRGLRSPSVKLLMNMEAMMKDYGFKETKDDK